MTTAFLDHEEQRLRLHLWHLDQVPHLDRHLRERRAALQQSLKVAGEFRALYDLNWGKAGSEALRLDDGGFAAGDALRGA